MVAPSSDAMETDAPAAPPSKAPPAPPPPPPVANLLAQAAALQDKAGKMRDVRGLPGRALRLAAAARPRVCAADVSAFVAAHVADGDAKAELLAGVPAKVGERGGRGGGGRARSDARAAAPARPRSAATDAALMRALRRNEHQPHPTHPSPPRRPTALPRRRRPRRAPRWSSLRTWWRSSTSWTPGRRSR